MISFHFYFRKKKVLDLSQENPKKKKAKTKDIPALSTCLSALFSPASDVNETEYKDTETGLKDDGGDVIDKSTVKKEQSFKITQTSSEDQQNYKLLYYQAMEEINQLQQKLKEQVKKELKEEVSAQIACILCCVRIIIIINKY